MDYKIILTAIAGGLCAAVGIYTFLAGCKIIGLIVFLIGAGNTHRLINILEKEMDLRQIEFWFKYPGFAIILLGALIGLVQDGWGIFSLSMVYFGLFMLIVGLIVRGKRM